MNTSLCAVVGLSLTKLNHHFNHACKVISFAPGKLLGLSRNGPLVLTSQYITFLISQKLMLISGTLNLFAKVCLYFNFILTTVNV